MILLGFFTFFIFVCDEKKLKQIIFVKMQILTK